MSEKIHLKEMFEINKFKLVMYNLFNTSYVFESVMCHHFKVISFQIDWFLHETLSLELVYLYNSCISKKQNLKLIKFSQEILPIKIVLQLPEYYNG